MCAFRQDRTPIPEETTDERKATFGQVLQPYTEGEAVLEAARCLQCAMPFCVQACPITQDCRGYIDLIAKRRFDEAARLVLRDNPLGTVLCKTCYHYCEEDCVKGGRGDPIAIRHLKRASLELGNPPPFYEPPKELKEERVAIVGAGPAGIMASWDLALRGYSVTVFEEHAFAGGQTTTIPKYHLAGDELPKDLDRFQKLGIRWEMGKKAGVDLTPEGLLEQGFQAVYLAMGASNPRRLGIPGEDLPGVFYALPFLLAINEGTEGLFGRKDRRVLVIGGGDVALDAARSARRLAVDGQVTLVYRRPEEDMRASEEEHLGGEIEGVHFLFERAPVEIRGDGHVGSMVLRRTELAPPDPQGKRVLVEVPGSEEVLDCDTIIVAAGEVMDTKGLPPELELKPSRHGWPEGVQPKHMTAVKGIFASGGQSVVYAMEAGAQAAQAIDAYLSQKKGRPTTPRPDPFGGAVPAELPAGYGGPTWHL